MPGSHYNQDTIEAEVLKTLHSLDELESLEFSPYFMTRLEARIDQPEPAGLRLGWRLAPVLLALVIVINVATAWAVLTERDVRQSIAREQNLRALAGEYSISPIDMLSGLNNE